MSLCVICEDPTDSTLQASLDGQPAGPACEDCAEWCDGNLVGVSE